MGLDTSNVSSPLYPYSSPFLLGVNANPVKSPLRCNVLYLQYEANHVDGLVQERRNSIANALELHLSCTNPSMWQQPASRSSWTSTSNISVTRAACTTAFQNKLGMGTQFNLHQYGYISGITIWHIRFQESLIWTMRLWRFFNININKAIKTKLS